MHKVVAGVVAIAALVAASTPTAGAGGDGGGSTSPPREVAVRDVRFAAGDVLTVALHPSTTPIGLSARGLDLEACPGTWDGKVATAGDTSWPSRDGFTECIPFTDGVVALPSAESGGGAMHLVFAVRARTANARPGSLTIRYEPADGFFAVAPPALDADARGPAIAVVPSTPTIAAGVTGYTVTEEQVDLRDVRLTVRQRGHVVRKSRSEELAVEHMWPVYAPVTAGRPVSVRATNDGRSAIRFAIGIDVG